MQDQAEFYDALHNLHLNGAGHFDEIIKAAMKAGQQFSIHGLDIDNQDIINDLVKEITQRISALMWLAGADMETFGDSDVAFQQAVSEAFEAAPISQREIQRQIRHQRDRLRGSMRGSVVGRRYDATQVEGARL